MPLGVSFTRWSTIQSSSTTTKRIKRSFWEAMLLTKQETSAGVQLEVCNTPPSF